MSLLTAFLKGISNLEVQMKNLEKEMENLSGKHMGEGKNVKYMAVYFCLYVINICSRTTCYKVALPKDIFVLRQKKFLD